MQKLSFLFLKTNFDFFLDNDDLMMAKFLMEDQHVVADIRTKMFLNL